MMYKEELEILTEARALLARPRGWIKGMNRDLAGGYCAYGAFVHVTPGHRPVARERAMSLLTQCAGWQNIIAFNDRSTTRKKDVLAMFDKAITLLRGEA